MHPNNERLDLQPHLDLLRSRSAEKTGFHGTSPGEFNIWGENLRAKVVRLLGLTDRTQPPVESEPGQSKLRGKFTQQDFLIGAGEGVLIPVRLLIPTGPPPFKAILAFHGHDATIDHLCGEFPDEDMAKRQLANHSNFAQALAEQGFLVAAIESRGFVRRTAKIVDPPFFPGDFMQRSCRSLSFEYMLQGRTLVGERVWDGMCVLNYLESREDVDRTRIGVTGHSGGATVALWLAMIEKRISVVVPSGYFCTLRDSILGMWHCDCNYIPGVLTGGELGEYASLLAPRAVRFISGEKDKDFPVSGTREEYSKVDRAYRLLESSEKCSLSVHPAGHRYDIPLALEWFAKWLK